MAKTLTIKGGTTTVEVKCDHCHEPIGAGLYSVMIAYNKLRKRVHRQCVSAFVDSGGLRVEQAHHIDPFQHE